MYSRYVMKPRIVIGIVSLMAALLLLVGCGNTKASLPSRVLGSKSTVAAVAILKHSPSGVVDMTWSPQSKELSVKLSLIGLAPKSVHPAHIHMGGCRSNGKMLYPLHDLVADDKGAATETTTITDVVDGIPASGWSVNVHNGPGLTTGAQGLAIACGEVTNPHAVASAAQSVRVWLGDVSSPNQGVSGTVQMNTAEGKLEVIIIVTGLTRKSVHAAHIHAGSCAQQGGVLYELKPVVADASGKGVSKTLLSNVKTIPANGWYVNVHLTTDMASQTGMDPIACGDVVLTH